MKTVFTLFLLTILLLTQSQIDSLTRFFPAVDWEKQLVMLHFEMEADENDINYHQEQIRRLESSHVPSWSIDRETSYRNPHTQPYISLHQPL